MSQNRCNRPFSLAKQAQLTTELLIFNNMLVIRENIDKHRCLFLDLKLDFFGQTNEKIKKATEGVNVIRK